MPTLNDLQARSHDAVNQGQALEAALEIVRFYSVFNTEYFLIEDKIDEAEDAIDAIDEGVGGHGVNQAQRQDLAEFLLEQHGRLDLLDRKLRAFEANNLNIAPPSPALVEQVKKETTKVAILQAKDNALAAIRQALTDIAKIADRSGLPT